MQAVRFQVSILPSRAGEAPPARATFWVSQRERGGGTRQACWAHGPRKRDCPTRRAPCARRRRAAGFGVRGSTPMGAWGRSPRQGAQPHSGWRGQTIIGGGSNRKGVEEAVPCQDCALHRLPRHPPQKAKSQSRNQRRLRGGVAARFTACAAWHGHARRLTLSWLFVSWPRAGPPSTAHVSRPWGRPSSNPQTAPWDSEAASESVVEPRARCRL